MPPRIALVSLLALATLPPFVARAWGSPAGDFAMFTTVDRYRVELSVDSGSGRELIGRGELVPHLSREARTVLLPVGGWGFGSDQADLIGSGLSDVGRLLCALRPTAVSSQVRLGRAPLEEPGLNWTVSITPCRAAIR